MTQLSSPLDFFLALVGTWAQSAEATQKSAQLLQVNTQHSARLAQDMQAKVNYYLASWDIFGFFAR